MRTADKIGVIAGELERHGKRPNMSVHDDKLFFDIRGYELWVSLRDVDSFAPGTVAEAVLEQFKFLTQFKKPGGFHGVCLPR